MTPADLTAIRKRLGLSTYEFGRAMGYAGTRQTVKTQVHDMEHGRRPIMPWIARLATMYDRYGVPADTQGN